MRQRLVILFLLVTLLSAGGCLMLPIPTAEDKVLAGTPVKPEQLAFLKAGTTTQQEVMQQLGQPNIIWEDARVYVYHWDMRKGILFWAVGGASQGAMGGGYGMTDIPKHYMLLLQFDDASRLMRFEKTLRPMMQPLSEFLVDWIKKPSQPPPTHTEPVLMK